MENIVGRKMLRLLLTNMNINEISPLKIEATTKYSDRFVAEEHKIYINFTNYDLRGIGKIPLCALGSSRQIVPKYDSLGDAIFHELCHALHTYSKKEQTACRRLDSVYQGRPEKYLWTDHKSEKSSNYEDDEELYNITGYFDGGFDPINCNMYDICKCVSNNEPIIQRVFHDSYKKLQKKVRSMEITDSCDEINKFLINLNDYIIRIPSPPPSMLSQGEKTRQPRIIQPNPCIAISKQKKWKRH
jgi:hypothetical protein